MNFIIGFKPFFLVIFAFLGIIADGVAADTRNNTCSKPHQRHEWFDVQFTQCRGKLTAQS
jgi:hypothetical protein